ncbi:MAG TPA: hypothetical protein VL651_00045 [Bacteroidia bacterium]|jgi:hypothetical protein|nr:hypothetical protein [Bacteroidia bacterium]
MNTDRTKKHILSTGISFLAIFCVFFSLGLRKQELPLDLKRVETAELIWPENTIPHTHVRQQHYGLHFRPGTFIVYSDTDKVFAPICAKDTSIKKIFLFGDSQVEFLRTSVYNFCLDNKYQLVAAIAWYGSTTEAWANCDTLDAYLEKYKPDFVICALGLNEVLTPSVEPRRKYIRAITGKIAAHHLPYYWIGPAAWTKDYGIVRVMQEELDTLFYPSDRLVLDRAPDKRHPSMEASKIWFDSVADAMSIHTAVSFTNKVHDYRKVENSPFIALGTHTAK